MKLQQRRDIELMILDHQDTCDIIKKKFFNHEESPKSKELNVKGKTNQLRRKQRPQSENLKQLNR